MKYICRVILIIVIILIGCTESWKSGKIYYTYDNIDDFTAEEVSLIRSQMDIWESCGDLNFIKVDVNNVVEDIIDEDIVIDENIIYLIQRDDPDGITGAITTIGYNESGTNYVIFKEVNKLSIIHELGHCLGLRHEHQRLDRCFYIDIDFSNIPLDQWSHFTLKNSNLYSESDYDYDYYSVMHYPGYAFAKDITKPTIIPRDKNILPEDLGGSTITATDCLKVQEIYGKRP